MQRDIFADTIGAVHVTGNLVRLDLMNLQPGEGSGKKELAHRLIIPLEGFVQAFNLQEQVVRQLSQNGILVDGRSFPAVSPKSEENRQE